MPERAGETLIRPDEMVAAPGGESSETGPWVLTPDQEARLSKGRATFSVVAVMALAASAKR